MTAPSGSRPADGRRALVRMHGRDAGILSHDGTAYRFEYAAGYRGPPVSLTMPVRSEPYTSTSFFAAFDGLLPEGWQLEALLRSRKLDDAERLAQLIAVGEDLVGAVTVWPVEGDGR